MGLIYFWLRPACGLTGPGMMSGPIMHASITPQEKIQKNRHADSISRFLATRRVIFDIGRKATRNLSSKDLM